MIAQPAAPIFGRYAGPAWARWSAAAAFGAAEAADRAGDRNAAARQCLGIILREPAHCDALHLLGMTALPLSAMRDGRSGVFMGSRVRAFGAPRNDDGDEPVSRENALA